MSKKDLHTRVATITRKDSDYVGEQNPIELTTLEGNLDAKSKKELHTRVGTLTRKDSDYIGEPEPVEGNLNFKRGSIAENGLSRTTSVTDNTRHFNDNRFANPDDTIPESALEENAVKDVPEVPMTAHFPPKNMWRIAACIGWAFSMGLSDAAPGAILPHIEAYYGIDYAVVSLIWISNAMGYILVAALAHQIQPFLGKQKSLMVGCSLSVCMYAIVSSGTKFPVIVVGFFLGGCGGAISISQMNVFLARLSKQSKYLALFHGVYGVGATVSPLAATSMVNAGITWHFYYLIILGTFVCHLVNFSCAFAGADEDTKQWDTEATEVVDPAEAKAQLKANMIVALKSHITLLLSLFVLFYQGGEVSLGGWIVTFLLDYRHGNPATVGYVASGFWGGLTIGRLCLTRPLHKYVGCRRSVILLLTGAIIFVGLTWGVTNTIAEAVLISIAGVLIGPNYPLMITYAALEGLIPRKIQVITLTISTAFGSSGGALFPFLIGVLSQGVGTFVVLPVFLGLYSVMLFLWICLPNIERKGTKLTLFMKFW